MYREKVLIYVLCVVTFVSCATVVDYLNNVCDNSVSVSHSRGLESHTSLFYAALMTCYYHVTVPPGFVVRAEFKRFDLEAKVSNACVDYVDLHDGSSTSSSTLNPSHLCGTKSRFTYTSSGTDMTLYFATDATGQKSGFYVVFSAISQPPCSSQQLECDSVCISRELMCDSVVHCSDRSDENNCPSQSAPGIYSHPQTDLIVGLLIGLGVILVIACVAGYFIWRHNRWRCLLKQEIKKHEILQHPTTYSNAYPVTKVYYQEKFQRHFKNIDKPIGTEWRNDRTRVLRELSPHCISESRSSSGIVETGSDRRTTTEVAEAQQEDSSV